MTRHGSQPSARYLLAINGGSSSLRFAVFLDDESLVSVAKGQIACVGQPGMTFTHSDRAGQSGTEALAGAKGYAHAIDLLLGWMQTQSWFAGIVGVGHRVVHGKDRTAPQPITPELLSDLERLLPFDPQHMPVQLALIAASAQLFPRAPHVACFDTAFHRGMPQVARLLAIPRRYQAAGLERYGFHGLSYEYCVGHLRESGDVAATRGRIVLAHLGSGASLAAVLDGRSIDTSMGFTAAAGLPMSSRAGDLDPGVAYYLARTEGMSPEQFHHMVTCESGLLGLSETSSDVRDLLAREADDERAADALALFSYQVGKWIGSFAAALGGIDLLVFTGGIGENAPVIRRRICERLGFLGIALDDERNAAGSAVISAVNARTTVRIIRTDEERVIARALLHHMRNS